MPTTSRRWPEPRSPAGREGRGTASRRHARALAAAVALALAAGCDLSERPRAPSTQRMLMGTVFRVQVVGDDRAAAETAMRAALDEVARVEELLSEWRDTSEISAVNRAAGDGPVPIGPELFEVLSRATAISELTDGAFDVTFAACGRLWSFREERIPSDDAIRGCLSRVDWRAVRLDPDRSTVELPEGFRIGIAGIGKGYGVDRAADVLEAHGFTSFTIDGGGDLRVSGRNGDRRWRVGIADPRRRGELDGAVEIERGAIVTSGDYELFFERDGVRYHHILDPRTGRPAARSAAVTVIAPSATDADALATGLFVLGPERALGLVETLPDVEARITAADLTVHRSSGFPSPAIP